MCVIVTMLFRHPRLLIFKGLMPQFFVNRPLIFYSETSREHPSVRLHESRDAAEPEEHLLGHAPEAGAPVSLQTGSTEERQS